MLVLAAIDVAAVTGLAVLEEKKLAIHAPDLAIADVHLSTIEARTRIRTRIREAHIVAHLSGPTGKALMKTAIESAEEDLDRLRDIAKMMIGIEDVLPVGEMTAETDEILETAREIAAMIET